MHSEPYLVTARKYRPRRFSDLVAQSHVSATLRNALKQERLAHAYLFSGPRGVGKTTAARILAQAINCTTPPDEREEMEPCGTCESCRTFQEGRSLNIIEIDAASNNSVEDIRALREKVRIPPQGARKKVYIIDEVHMLSNAAFNALLKTLEEPPPHILFIFATTEPHKVLPTILSRCQRFDFHRISVAETVDRLREISSAEGIEAEEEALMLIAKKGDGALRDALSVFDQSVALCGSPLRYPELADALGVVDIDLFFDVTSCISESDSTGILRICDQLIRSGYDFVEFLAGLAEHIRNLLVVAGTGSDRLIEASEPVRARYRETASDFGENDLLHMLMVLDQAESTIKSSAQPRLKLEMTLLKLVKMPRTVDFQALLDRLDALQNDAPAGAGKGNAAPSGGTASGRNESREEVGSRPSGAAQPRAESERLTPAGRETPPQAHRPEPPSGKAQVEETPPPRPSSTITADPPNRERGAGTAAAGIATAERKLSVFAEPALKVADNGGAPFGVAEPSESGTAVAPVTAEPPASPQLQAVLDEWPACVNAIMVERIHAGAVLKHCVPVGLSGGTVEIGVPDDFHQRSLNSISELVLNVIRSRASGEIRQVRFIVRRDLPHSGVETDAEIDPFEQIQKLRQENPLVRAILDKFGGEMVW